MSSSYWICDNCGDKIEKVEDGYVEWINSGDKRKGLRLVHNRHSCLYNEDRFSTSGDHLKEFVGPDGLMQLLMFTSWGKYPLEELLEMIKRLHIPDYVGDKPLIIENKK